MLQKIVAFWGFTCPLRREEWALALRKHLLPRGNNTNNLSEAGIKILKEIVSERVQAYNLVQILVFITITLDYLEQRQLAVAHLRLDSCTALKFRGVAANSVSLSNIQPLDVSKGQYKFIKGKCFI